MCVGRFAMSFAGIVSRKGVPINQRRSQHIALAVLCTGIFLAALDQTVVVTVLPRIIDDLEGGFSPAGVERAGWIVTAYLFGFTVVLPLMGRVADLYGHRRTYNLAMLIFAAGSLLCAVSGSLYMLVGFRAIQAIGGGAVVPIAMAVVGHNFPEGRTGAGARHHWRGRRGRWRSWPALRIACRPVHRLAGHLLSEYPAGAHHHLAHAPLCNREPDAIRP